MGIVIVHHMEIAMSAPWHSLDQTFTEMIEGDGDLHDLVPVVGITVTQQHDLRQHELIVVNLNPIATCICTLLRWMDYIYLNTYLVVSCEVIIGDGDGGGTHDGVNKTVCTIGERTVVNPDMARPKNGDAIAIRNSPPPIM